MKIPVLPLRVKLTAWALFVFFMVHVTASVLWISMSRWFEQSKLERTMRKDAEFIAASLSSSPSPSNAELDTLLGRTERPEALGRYIVQVYDKTGAEKARSTVETKLASVKLHAPGEPNPNGIDSIEFPLTTGEKAHLRVLEIPLTIGEDSTFQLFLAATNPFSDGLIATIVGWMSVGSFIGLIAAGTMAWYIAGRAVAPIKRMTKAAQSVNPANLQRRIDIDPQNSEMKYLQKELNDALERLEKGYRAQGMFISNVSHELKTPIAVLLSEAQVLKQGDRSAEEYNRFLATVEGEMRILGKLVESFLVLARVEHGKELVRREPVSVNDVVVEAAEHCAPIARRHEVSLVTNLHLAREGEGDAELDGDPELLRTMVENLVRNALRFSPRGAAVDLRVERQGLMASITVRDRGPGIPKEYVEHVFERYFQVPHESASASGVGLGLAIAKSIADLHHGSIRARNCSDGGCEFEVRLPVRDTEDRSAERQSRRATEDTTTLSMEPRRAAPAARTPKPA